MTLTVQAIDAFDLLDHGESGDFDGPDQRMTRKLTNEDVEADQGRRPRWGYLPTGSGTNTTAASAATTPSAARPTGNTTRSSRDVAEGGSQNRRLAF